MDPSDFELLRTVNLYEMLNLTKEDFTPELAKKSYRKLALKFHPDKNPDAPPDKFEAIQLAYLILSTPEYKEQYDSIYDIDSQAKDFKDLATNYSKEANSFQFEKISEEDFAARIHSINLKNSAQLEELNNQSDALDAVNKMIIERTVFSDEVLNQNKQMANTLSGVTNTNELNKKFNELFESTNDQVDKFNDSVAFGQTGLTVFNGCDTLSNYTTLSNMNYDSMYAGNSTYEESFKLNKVPKYVDDNKSLEDRMKEYLSTTNELASIAKKSTSSNLNSAVYQN
jgi:curved DNA-binding protein CbpA